MIRTLWRAVAGVDFRPFDRKGRRVPGNVNTHFGQRAWRKAVDDCKARGIRAWFAVAWEARLS